MNENIKMEVWKIESHEKETLASFAKDVIRKGMEDRQGEREILLEVLAGAFRNGGSAVVGRRGAGMPETLYELFNGDLFRRKESKKHLEERTIREKKKEAREKLEKDTASALEILQDLRLATVSGVDARLPWLKEVRLTSLGFRVERDLRPVLNERQ